MAKILTLEEWQHLKKLHCDRGKHRFRTNTFGVSWCTICGALSNKDFPPANEEECLIIRL